MSRRLVALAFAGAMTLAEHPAAAFAVPNPYATGTDPGSIAVGTLLAFGDSYSAAKRKAFPNWIEQMKAAGELATLADFAKSGATAGSYAGYANTWATQIKKWRATSPTFGPRDLTVVYLGYNDIDGGTAATGADLALAEGSYRTDLGNVIGAGGGATSGGRRVLLVMPHNWGRSPYYVRTGGSSTMGKRTKVWDAFVAKQAQGRQNVIAVDMYTALEFVFSHAGDFGFTNITAADHSRSSTTAFFDDDFHPGRHGQRLIAQVVEYYLTKGWDWANQTKAPASAKAKLQAALTAGEVFGAGSNASVASVAGPQTAAVPVPTPRRLQDTPEHFGVAWAAMLAARKGR